MDKMDRARKISILANMSDEALTRAMEANGIPCDENYLDNLGPEMAQEMESWAEIDASIPRTIRPSLVNSEMLFRDKLPNEARLDIFGSPGGDEEFYAQQQDLGLEMF